MKKYSYFRVGWSIETGDAGVYLRATDMSALERILDKLKKAGMSYKAVIQKRYAEFDGLVLAVDLSSLRDRDGTVALWIIKQLCDNGWEPFASTGGFVALKRVVEEDKVNS